MTEKKFITEADGVHKEWYELARKQRLDTVGPFLASLMDDYSHDQQTVVHALTAGAMAAICAMNAHAEGDIGQQQAHAILGEFIRRWAKIEGPAKIMSFAGLLHPQNQEQIFSLPAPVVTYLKTIAAKGVAEGKYQDEVHKAHLEKIAAGEFPWGFKA